MNLNLRSLSVHVTVILQSGLQYFCSSAIWTHCPKLHSLFFSFFWWIKILIQHYTCMQLPNESNSAEVSILWGIRLNSRHWNWACLLYLYDWLRTKCIYMNVVTVILLHLWIFLRQVQGNFHIVNLEVFAIFSWEQ